MIIPHEPGTRVEWGLARGRAQGCVTEMFREPVERVLIAGELGGLHFANPPYQNRTLRAKPSPPPRVPIPQTPSEKESQMPAQSEAQQKAAGAALSAKRGDTKVSDLQGASKDMYDSMSESELEDLASTRHDNLPERKGD